ncbi:kelch-like protein diablo [Dendronephthya gigantea]|uniref:kelch-like protein diablo n=1 Tax=Dendronephthya gigantea TaxID=151771 RepID=UPI00106C4982|nr:kelch-like protein diablo [Dendronephthya gigantea]XP_028400922.1 kelch-like protein diablo [Dendronephthya gigantea]XP_028400923.1 kelch-like protein diablo [Dendronephthya gigantea]
MAEKQSPVLEFGYPDERFESVVSENLYCAICSCVLKNPLMCKNEHCFCRACITMHLENYQNCPTCKHDLSVDSLMKAPRILRNLLSEKRIKCDYYERGCEEIIELGNLASHVAVCGKAPVVCSNEECSREINREDQTRHESEECRFWKIGCRNFEEMGSMIQEIGTGLGGLCEQVTNLSSSVNEQISEVKTGLTAVENRFDVMESRFEVWGKKFEKIEKQLFFQENQTSRDQRHEVVDDLRVKSDQATAVDPSNDIIDEGNPVEHAYVVAGGYGKDTQVLNSSEVFDKSSNSWRPLPPMERCRANASSVCYNGHVNVAGGVSEDKRVLSSVEQFSRFWSNFPVNLPKLLKGHRTVGSGDKMFVVGGYDQEKKGYSNMIYEIQLRLPFNTKVLARLPFSTPVRGCGVVKTNDKILIFGGSARDTNPATAIVTMYDLTKNEFKELAPLPYSVCNMATAKYEENVVLAGGSDNYLLGDVKNTVISYNIETQKSVMLPPMKCSRSECCAVVDGDSLVVMGGENRRFKCLNSVEEFNFRTSKWTGLPSMKTERKAFVAEVI